MSRSNNGGKRIFITGGASGLGLAIAHRYAREGWRVCIGDINAERGAIAKKELAVQAAAAVYLHCNVTHEEDLQAAADKLVELWGGVDVVVNNAGVAGAGRIEDVPLSDWKWIFDINLFGVVSGCRIFTRLFKQQGHGYLINVASMAGLMDVPMMSSYNASKAAVVSLSETLEIELSDAGIGVSVVCPSFFKTNLTESMRSTDPRLTRKMYKLFERGKVTAEEIADRIYEAQQQGRFYVLPHGEGRNVWYLKRFLPRWVYARQLVAVWNRSKLRHKDDATHSSEAA
jgi:NAD(P)-dependent dehydrogenase (short-subunit alcohol dehydrogenase family)